MRVNSERSPRPITGLAPGDVLTMTVHERLRVLRLSTPGERRGPATEAQALYEDLSPPLPRHDPLAVDRACRTGAGAGRPTKKERREIDRFRSASEPGKEP